MSKPTAPAAAANNNNTPPSMDTTFVWVRLYWADKTEEPAGDDPIKIRPLPDDVADLKAAVLPRLDPALLGGVKVFPPKSCANREKYPAGKQLSAVMAELSGTTPPTSTDHPLVVVAPKTDEDGIQQLPQLSESTIAVLNEMAGDYVRKKRTIRLSDATQGAKTDLMDMLSFPEKGASWPDKPLTFQRVNVHSWLNGYEDSEENRQAYMAFLKTMLQLPDNYDLADVQPDRMLLSVELFREMAESRKVSGTTDVAIAKSQHVRNGALRNNIEALLELKTPKNMKSKDHSPQVIGEHFAASYLNPNHAVVSVLTDLNTRWIFFWYALGDDDSRMALHKLDLNCDGAAAEAKYLLDSLYDNSIAYTLPTTFAERQPFRAVMNDYVQRKRARIDLDGGNGHNPDQDSKPSASGGTEGHPGSNAESSSEKNDSSGNQGGTGGGGSAPMSMAHALSLFAPPADRDVANELDLLDMLSPNEQYEIVSKFALRHIVPYMRGSDVSHAGGRISGSIE